MVLFLLTLKILLNVVDNSNNEKNFPHNTPVTQVSKFRKVFANNGSANIKLSKYQLHKTRQSERF